uniref:Kinesin-like protein n=1 Tax=Marsilea vestita TaxID=59764 RepID=A0A142KWA6_MARVE|nr:kinesin 7-IIe protein [Marsilea vestita]
MLSPVVKASPESAPQQPPPRGREKILVTVRVRPLSSREIAQRDPSAWDCIDFKSVVFKVSHPDRSPQTKSYKFDRVFGPDSVTNAVYEEGAKDVALSALKGLNATIFAYGQTSSGKTFTMRGIVENAIRDIYSFIEQQRDRNFILKVSALEIYNEIVKDLLVADGGPLRLLDDPEKGTVVEKLTEDTVKDIDHLKRILSNVEAHRQVGETMLNEASSRSHQIIRLTVENFPQKLTEEPAVVNSLVATLNFVDLAGSERASQTLAEGNRLKEGSHINRSLLTLTTIIRKLSSQVKGKSVHLPYRDSKLTRILQNSLGGNARTAIICTMSPAYSHVEQSRNTLFFATQAKEVVNSARVNVVVSDKELVKQLQKEVARLEAELKTDGGSRPSNTEALLSEKDAEIQKLRDEMRQLYLQRDQAQARLDEVLKKASDEVPEGSSQHSVSPTSTFQHPADQASPSITKQTPTASVMLVQEIRKLEHMQDELGEDASRALEALQKEVECLRLAQSGMNQDSATTIAKLQAEIRSLHKAKHNNRNKMSSTFAVSSVRISVRDEIKRLNSFATVDENIADTTIATLEEQLESVQKSLDTMLLDSKCTSEGASPRTAARRKAGTPLTSGTSASRRNLPPENSSSPRARRTLSFENNENNPPSSRENRSLLGHGSQKQTPLRKKTDPDIAGASKELTPKNQRNSSVDIRKMQSMFKTAAEENIRSIRAYVVELKERVAKLQYQKQLLVCQVLDMEANGGLNEDENQNDPDLVCMAKGIPSMSKFLETWPTLFTKQRKQIVQLWDTCQVSIVHRSQFYLLFKGDPADKVYMEVELRRLTWLQEQFSQTTQESGCEDDESSSLAASLRALKRERDLLAKRIKASLQLEEREELFAKWQIPVDSKQRKMQLVYKIWTDTQDLAHIEDSAKLVARVAGFWEPGKAASKEMFELAFAPPSNKKPWVQGWNAILNNLGAM